MEIKVELEGDTIGPKLKKNMDKLGGVVREAMREAAHETADFIMFRGAEDIAEAGNFGDRWQDAWQAEVSETQRTVYVEVAMRPKGPPVTFWRTFEYGATHHARNPSGYMWLPFIGFDREKVGTDVWPRAYSGGLFKRISKAGNPVLFDVETKEPRYVGKEEVTIPKLFHLHEIAAEEAKKTPAVFKRILKEMKNV